MEPIILASKSPRRKELLSRITGDFEIIVSDAEERLPEGITAEEAPVYLASLKAGSVSEDHPGRTVIGADTVVILDGEILGKPKDEKDAFSMLKKLSGRTHTVITGCCITDGEQERRFYESTSVTFYELSDREIRDYIATGDPMDKAGSYGIQEKATLFVRGIEGDFFNVMGLPIAKLYRELKLFKENGE